MPETTPESGPDREATRRRFDDVAATYDGRFVRFIDRYDEALDLVAALVGALVGALRPGPRAVLDLGAGTGEVSRRLLQVAPGARVHAVDFSERMLDQARAKLAGHGARFTCEAADLARFDPAGAHDPYDAVVSAFAVHHLADAAKRDLCRRAVAALAPGGVFVNADLVKGATDLEQRTVLELHTAAMRARGLSEEEVQERLRRHREHDLPATLSDQLRWLEESGCVEAWSPWRHLHQAIVVGVRSR